MNPEIGGLAQGLNAAIQQYMGMNIQNMQSDYQGQQAAAAKRAQSDYEFGQQKEMMGLKGQQDMKMKLFEGQLDLSKEKYKATIADVIKRGQSVRLGSLVDDPEFASLGTAAPDAIIDAKDLLDWRSKRDKNSQEKSPKEFQYKASNYLKMASNAENIMKQLDEEGMDLTAAGPIGRADMTPEILRGDKWKSFMGARKAIAQAYLRPATGATINADEYADVDRIFIPMPNDSPDVLAEKKAARQNLMNNLKAESEGKVIDNSLSSIDRPGSSTSNGGWSIRKI